MAKKLRLNELNPEARYQLYVGAFREFQNLLNRYNVPEKLLLNAISSKDYSRFATDARIYFQLDGSFNLVDYNDFVAFTREVHKRDGSGPFMAVQVLAEAVYGTDHAVDNTEAMRPRDEVIVFNATQRSKALEHMASLILAVAQGAVGVEIFSFFAESYQGVIGTLTDIFASHNVSPESIFSATAQNFHLTPIDIHMNTQAWANVIIENFTQNPTAAFAAVLTTVYALHKINESTHAYEFAAEVADRMGDYTDVCCSAGKNVIQQLAAEGGKHGGKALGVMFKAIDEAMASAGHNVK